MSKRKRHPRKGGRVTPKGTRPANWSDPVTSDFAPPPEREPDLNGNIRRALRADSPFELVGLASSMVESLTDRPLRNLQQRSGPPSFPASTTELIEEMIDVEVREVNALLRAIVALLPDELARRRYTARLQAQPIAGLPRWIDDLEGIEVTSATEMRHVLGDGDNIFLEFRWGTGEPATFLVYIDHNMGTLTKDCFVVPASIDNLLTDYRRLADTPDITFEPIDLAEARAKIGEAIDLFEICVPPIETETWPMCRPLLEQVLRAMPEGGTGYDRVEPEEGDHEELIERFLDAPQSDPVVADPDTVGLLERCCGSPSRTGPATRCAGARCRSRSCSPTSSPAR